MILSNQTQLSALTRLSIWGNSIGDAGVFALSNSLKSNSTLRYLDLSFTLISDLGTLSLSDSLKSNSTLTTLCLDTTKSKGLQSQITDELAKNKGLFSLYSLLPDFLQVLEIFWNWPIQWKNIIPSHRMTIETTLMCCKEICLPGELENLLIKFFGNAFKILDN